MYVYVQIGMDDKRNIALKITAWVIRVKIAGANNSKSSEAKAKVCNNTACMVC